jgi:hypothetical protein
MKVTTYPTFEINYHKAIKFQRVNVCNQTFLSEERFEQTLKSSRKIREREKKER